jgi:hypothetical protein
MDQSLCPYFRKSLNVTVSLEGKFYYGFGFPLQFLKVKEFRNRPGVAQRVPGDLGSQIS